jgi:N-acetylglutamate synthase-like GNAT family acetyltransferase
MRMVRQLAQALARIAGLRKASLLDEALAEADASMAGLGGVDPRLVDATGAAVLVAVIRDPARREAVGRILLERAEIAAAQGEQGRAAALREKAEALLASAGGSAPAP